MKNTFSLLLALLLCPLFGKAQPIPVYLDDTQPIEARVQDALARMTLEEKVRLCTAQSKFSSHGVPRLGIPEIWMSDGPHGVREEISWDSWNAAGFTNDSCTAFPALTCLAATWNPEMAALYGKSVGEEARYRRKDILLGPGCNIYRTPLNGRNFEYLGEDPYLASTLIVPYVRELQKNGVAACVKHFALNNQEKWRGHIDVEVSDRALYEIYLPAFKAAVQKGDAWSVMGSYNRVRGEHACHNDLLLNRILKGEWAFDGCVVTDWGGAHDTREAVFNGLDIEMGTYTDGLSKSRDFAYDNYHLAKKYLQGLQDGTYPLATVEDKAARVLRLIFRTAMNRQRPWGAFTSQAHYDAARRIGEEGIVLLKNETPRRARAALLPIDTTIYRHILVVGDNAVRRLTEGGGSSELKVQHEISPLQGLTERYGDKITYTQGYAAGRPRYGKTEEPTIDTDSLRRAALELAREADLVIFIGGLNKNYQQDCEAGDRIQYSLPFGQDELIPALAEVNPRMVLVLLSGNAVEMKWVKKIPAIVQGWYLGSEAGHALSAVLSGEVCPSGKLPFSFPVQLADNGAHAFDALCYPGDSIHEVYKEDIFVGYRWHDTRNIPALFPFGHGLSYTTFDYGKATLSAETMQEGDTLTLTVPVKNSGAAAGKEVVQLYIGDVESSLPRPTKELKAFRKIDLKAGETRDVTFDITADDLRYFDDARHDWVAESGKFVLYVGSSSTDIRARKTITLK